MDYKMDYKMEFTTRIAYNAKFSMDELIPKLETRISEIMGEEYTIDCFITNQGASIVDVNYIAFPKEESYVHAMVIQDDILITCKRENDKKQSFSIKEVREIKKNPAALQDFETDYAEFNKIMRSKKIIHIGHEQIALTDMLDYLYIEKPSKYYLYSGFFDYPENEQINEVILEFANTVRDRKQSPKQKQAKLSTII